MEAKKKKYVANGKQVGEYELVNFSLCLDKLDPDFITEYEGKQYIKLTISKNKTVDRYGNTHSVYINEYKKPETSVEPDSVPF